jgi:hypothetical protein
MITEAENIILSKQYFELTADELATVGELVQNAEEFEEMKWFLAATTGALAGEKIDASPELREKVMEHLNQPKEKRRFWLNGVMPFLLPEDKRFYQKPAFQMSIAALLIIGFIMIMPGKIGEDKMAMNDKDFGLKEFHKSAGEAETTEIETGEAIDALDVPEMEWNTVVSRSEEKNELELAEEIILEDNINDLKLEVDELPVNSPPNDGYFNGVITDDDRKRMEAAKNTAIGNTNSRTLANDITVTPGNTNVPELAPIVNESSDLGEDAFASKADKTDLKGKEYRDSKKDKLFKDAEKKERFDEVNDDEVLISNNVEEIALGGASFKEELNQTIKADSLTTYFEYDQSNEVSKPNEIMPYKLHVNQTKELKSLFTTFK